MTSRPGIAIIGAGIFVRTQYIPRFAEISNLLILKAIWSRSEASSKTTVDIAKEHFIDVECKWGEDGLDEIAKDESIHAVAVVLAGQAQVDISLRFLRAGKHVLQEKPAGCSVKELELALSSYNYLPVKSRPIWAIAENYRFEAALVEGRKIVKDIGPMMSVQVIVEGSMNNSNPYFPSTWRRNLSGAFIMDMGVHFIAGLRMLVGCEVTSVNAITRHVDASLPSPDTLSSVFELENGCSGIFVMVVSSRAPKIFWRVVGMNGTLQVERAADRPMYRVLLDMGGGQSTSTCYPFGGVNEELTEFCKTVSEANLKKENGFQCDCRLTFLEGAKDVAVLEAMLESAAKGGSNLRVASWQS